MRIVLTAIVILFSVLSASSQKTKILTADKHNEYGLVYTLPTTVLDVKVTASRTIYEAGPFWQYAEKYIGSNKVIKEDAELWQITDVVVTSRGVANMEKEYQMQFKPGALVFISVSDNNMLEAINKEVPEVVAKNHRREKPEAESLPMDTYLEFVDEDFLSSQSSAKQAQMLAQSLMDVREAKISLSRGTAETMPTDGRQLELMLNSLARQEKSFMQAFTGKSRTEEVSRTYSYTPDEDVSEVLFRFSDFAGFVDKDDYSGDPVNVEVSNIERAELPADDKGETKSIPKDAVVYMIPGRATIALTHKGDNLYEETTEFAQFGMEYGVSPALFSDKRSRSYALFNPVTGALKEIGEINAE